MLHLRDVYVLVFFKDMASLSAQCTINLHRASKPLVFTRRGRLELPAPVVRALKIGNSADIPNGLL